MSATRRHFPARASVISIPTQEGPIGVFDSGLGGLTVVRQLRRALPHEDLVYLGDTARVPYGTKSPEAVTRFATEAMQFLQSQSVKAVVIACNTATAWALTKLQRRFDLPLFGVISPGVQAALAKSVSRRIGVIATPATVRSQAYQKSILKKAPTAHVYSQACALLVPLVEEGWQNQPVTDWVLKEYLTPLLRENIDTLVLGCTHYPLLKRSIRRVAGRKLMLIDSADVCAKDVATQLRRLHLLAEHRNRKGRFLPFVTDDAPHFAETASRILRIPVRTPKRVELPSVDNKPSRTPRTLHALRSRL